MSGKIMEVLQVKPDYRRNTAKIRLGDTGFAAFGKEFSDVPGQTVESADVDEYLGFQIIHDLYLKQRVIFDKLDSEGGWKETFNSWVDLTNGSNGISDIPTFEPNLVISDYTGDFTEDTPADWQHLTRFVQAEKDLFKFIYEADMHMITTQEILKEWSKNRLYTATTATFRSPEFETGSSQGSQLTIVSLPSWISASVSEVGSKNYRVNMSGDWETNLPMGGSFTLNARGRLYDGWNYHFGNFYTTYVRTPLFAGDTDGYLREDTTLRQITNEGNTNAAGRINGSIYHTVPTGEHTPHLDAETPTLPWFESRVFI